MKPEISYFILGSLVETYKYIVVEDGHFFTEKQTGESQIKMHDNNGKSFIAKLYDVLLEKDLCDLLFSIIKLMNLVYTYFFVKGFARFCSVIINRT